jgi:hypothetical protein
MEPSSLLGVFDLRPIPERKNTITKPPIAPPILSPEKVPDKISLINPETMEKSRNIEKNLLITLEKESFGFLFITYQ